MEETNLPQEAASTEGDDREHDRLAWRLCSILQRLNNGEQLDPHQLSAEYGVHRRTIIRDLTERFAFLPLDKIGKRYTLDPAYLGRLSFRDIERFAALAGLKGLFPSLDKEFFRELLDSRLRETFTIHGPNHEDLRCHIDNFRVAQRAITGRHILRFTYLKDDGPKTVEAMPYRLINNDGLWYLAAVNDGKPKAYSFSKLRSPEVLDVHFNHDLAIVNMLNAEDSIWLNTQKIVVRLAIAPPAAAYFRRRKLISHQAIEKDEIDGSLIISGKFAHPNQLLPTVRYWLPNIKIITPMEWQHALESGLREYLDPGS